MSEFSDLLDADVRDIGMYRCACGEAVYPNGVLSPHCDKDDAHTKG